MFAVGHCFRNDEKTSSASNETSSGNLKHRLACRLYRNNDLVCDYLWFKCNSGVCRKSLRLTCGSNLQPFSQKKIYFVGQLSTFRFALCHTGGQQSRRRQCSWAMAFWNHLVPRKRVYCQTSSLNYGVPSLCDISWKIHCHRQAAINLHWQLHQDENISLSNFVMVFTGGYIPRSVHRMGRLYLQPRNIHLRAVLGQTHNFSFADIFFSHSTDLNKLPKLQGSQSRLSDSKQFQSCKWPIQHRKQDGRWVDRAAIMLQ